MVSDPRLAQRFFFTASRAAAVPWWWPLPWYWRAWRTFASGNPAALARSPAMLSHVSLGTNDAARAAAFYDPVLAVLGIRKGRRRGDSVDYSAAMIGFSLEQPTDGEPASVGNGVHVCFAAETRAEVDQFHRVALEHGGEDAGAPGLRPEYDANYYAAFVRDPDGNKIEAVCFLAK